MKKSVLVTLLICCLFSNAQDSFRPPLVDESEFVIDGQLEEKIWQKATQVPFDIEFNPANNQPAQKETTAYICLLYTSPSPRDS